MKDDIEIKTSCESCVFALGHKYAQTGCKLNRLGKFEKQGATLSTLDEEESPYYTIYGRFCSAKRTSKWQHARNPNKETIVRAEIIIKPEILILVGDYQNYLGDPNRLVNTLQSINSQILKPHRIRIIASPAGVNYSKLLNVVRDNCKVEWFVDRLISKDSEEWYTREEAVDLIVNKVESDYFISCLSGYKFEPELLANIDKAINEELMRFSVLLINEQANTEFISTALHNKIGGHKKISASFFNEEEKDDLMLESRFDKINYLANLNNQQYMIKTYEEVCQQLS